MDDITGFNAGRNCSSSSRACDSIGSSIVDDSSGFNEECNCYYEMQSYTLSTLF